MTQINENTQPVRNAEQDEALVAAATNAAQRNKVIVTINGADQIFEQATLGVTMASTDEEILAAAQASITESLRDTRSQYSFTVSKALNSNNIHIFPKPHAG